MLGFILLVLVIIVGKKIYDKVKKDERVCSDMTHIICRYNGVEKNKENLIPELDVAPYIAQEAMSNHHFCIKNTPASPREFTYRTDSAFALMDYADTETSKGHYHGNLYNACLSFLITEGVIDKKQAINMKKEFINLLKVNGYREETIEAFSNATIRNKFTCEHICL